MGYFIRLTCLLTRGYMERKSVAGIEKGFAEGKATVSKCSSRWSKTGKFEKFPHECLLHVKNEDLLGYLV